ncbi:MAG: hypothetical protein ACRDGE_03930 [Candidatus Limnocylindria bacterium]
MRRLVGALSMWAFRRRVSGRALAAIAIAAIAALLVIDTARADQRRLDDLHRDLAVAGVSISEDTLTPQLALNEFAASWDTILAAINARSEHFRTNFALFQELFPEARALHVATSPGNTVALVGEPELYDALQAATVSSFCVDGKAYAVVSTGIGPRGWVAVALDPERSVKRARAAAQQPVRLALIEVGATEVLADDRGSGCTPLQDDSYQHAAGGEYGVSLVARRDGRTAVGYTPIVGTALSVVLEDDPAYRETAAWARRAAITGLGGLLLAGGHVVWRLRRPRDVAND